MNISRRRRLFQPTPRALTAALGCLLLGACATRSGYLHHGEPSLVQESQLSAQDNQPMYLDLIRQMQQQGAYYASLAHIDAFRQKYGNPPELRQLQANALRETGQFAKAATLYQGLLNSDQAGAAWHGLGLVAAAQHQNGRAEQALAKAVQIAPVNGSYLGDLGYQRLQAGQIASAYEPLVKAAELAPGNIKAESNLVLWMLLNGDYAQADAAMQQANLPQPAQAQVRKLAAQLHLAAQAAPAVVVPDAMPAPARMPHRVAPPQNAARSPPSSQPASPAQIAGVPPGSMLDRFGSASTPSEARP
ncbi:Flp pilus assembly protein TadD [Rhodanobacter sp. Col0626]|uniref:Flp pilus assembly protein TadD n=1 Tax=Rhodanobacter sp. Col0626 TaxID=3415679 RepID=UPI003CE6FE2B